MHPNLILASTFTNQSKELTTLMNIVLVSIGIIAMSLLSQIAIPLPYTPVPMTGQTFGVLSIGLLYGRRLGLITILSYIALGTLGLPIFSNGKSGFLFFSASGGYLIGYIFAVLLCGRMAEKGWTQSYLKMFLLLLMAETLIYTFGLLQLHFFIKSSVFAAGLYPFIFGDLAKMALVIAIFPTAWKIKNRYMQS